MKFLSLIECSLDEGVNQGILPSPAKKKAHDPSYIN